MIIDFEIVFNKNLKNHRKQLNLLFAKNYMLKIYILYIIKKFKINTYLSNFPNIK